MAAFNLYVVSTPSGWRCGLSLLGGQGEMLPPTTTAVRVQPQDASGLAALFVATDDLLALQDVFMTLSENVGAVRDGTPLSELDSSQLDTVLVSHGVNADGEQCLGCGEQIDEASCVLKQHRQRPRSENVKARRLFFHPQCADVIADEIEQFWLESDKHLGKVV